MRDFCCFKRWAGRKMVERTLVRMVLSSGMEVDGNVARAPVFKTRVFRWKSSLENQM